MLKPKISVLMSVYNTKQYLDEAIKSVLNQTFDDFEFIIINDGSTDGSGEVLEQYKRRDSRIRVYHIENSGIANCRNRLISYALGDYIAYVDADDFVNSDYLESLYKAILDEGADIAVCSYKKYVVQEKMFYFPVLESGYEMKCFNAREVYENYYSLVNGYGIVFAVAWGKLVRRELFDNIYFPDGKLHEDSCCIYKLYFFAKKIVYVNKHLYVYRVRENSIVTTDWTRERIRDFVEQHEERITLLTALGIPITKGNIDDYKNNLKRFEQITLKKGFVNEYKWITQKIKFLEMADEYKNQ